MSIAARNAILADGGSQPSGGYWGLCFTAEQANSTVAMVANGSAPSVNLLYSTDAANWSPFVVGTTTVTLASVGDKVWIKAGTGGNTAMATATNDYNNFSLSGLVAASGSIQSLIDGDSETFVIQTPYCFRYLFRGCASLTAAPELPAETLADSCYSAMFYQCISLTTAPTLPAETLASSCYNSMFHGCSSLNAAPSLPATTMGSRCYASMFRNCTSLTTAPSLPATTLGTYCYQRMFYGCTSLTTAPSLPATTLATYCYDYMFYGCTSLTTAPELPAKSLKQSCYTYMFQECSSLSSIRIGSTTKLNAAYSANWVQHVAATGTFYCPTALGTDETITRAVYYCPAGWTVINTDA